MNKETLQSLIKLKNQYLQSKDIFEKQKLFFNMKVEDKLKEENTIEVEGYDYYEHAQYIIEIFQEKFQETAFQHPDYSKEQIKEILLENEDLDVLKKDYELYLRCGYFNVREKEKNLEHLKTEIKTTLKETSIQSKNNIKNQAIKIGNITTKIIKPYGEVAKGQLEEASIFTKKTINKGSKKLIKTLQKVVDKTEKFNK